MTQMLNPALANGRRRPSLAEQINRLDNMLDGLSDGLNEAVADAVRVGVGTAVKEAVQAVLTEVLASPELRARLQKPADATAKTAVIPEAAIAPVDPEAPTPNPQGWWQRVRACIGYMRAVCSGLVTASGLVLDYTWQRTCEHFIGALTSCSMLWPFRYQIVFAVIIGVLVGIGVTHAEPWLAAFASGVGGFVTTLTVQAGLWLRKVLAPEPREVA